MKPNSRQEIIEGIASVIPILFLAGIIRVIVMAVRRIKEAVDPFSKGWSYLMAAESKAPETKMSDLKKIAEPKPKNYIFKYLLKQWQFWVVIILLMAAIVVSNNDQVVAGSIEKPAVVQEQQSVTTALQQVMVGMQGIVAYVPVLVAVFIIFTIISIFIKLGNKFK
jgi:uncharacterized membrane protein